MFYIAHRGNLNGPNPKRENHPDYLMKAINQGFDVELDVWLIDGKFILGHDAPQYEVEKGFLCNGFMWCHAKNIEFAICIDTTTCLQVSYFFHNTDDYALVSNGRIWTYPGKSIINENQVAVMPERVPDWDISLAGGICSDYARKYKFK